MADTSSSPILDLAAVCLEVNDLDRASCFYESLLGLSVASRDDRDGRLVLSLPNRQKLECWLPLTRRAAGGLLSGLGARGGVHLHFALQIPRGASDLARSALRAHGLTWQEINLAAPDEEPDVGLYFYDPFGHGLELREVESDRGDPRAPFTRVGIPSVRRFTLPVIGLREIVLAFTGAPETGRRLREAYGLAFLKESDERFFLQFALGVQAKPDGRHTPQRWLYAWDPQVGLAGMLPGEHVTARFLADLDALRERLAASGLQTASGEDWLAARDTDGHVFQFIQPDAWE